jgi:hypothetical protein
MQSVKDMLLHAACGAPLASAGSGRQRIFSCSQKSPEEGGGGLFASVGLALSTSSISSSGTEDMLWRAPPLLVAASVPSSSSAMSSVMLAARADAIAAVVGRHPDKLGLVSLT